MLSIIYPHIEKVAGQPARLQRIPRVAEIEQEIRAEWEQVQQEKFLLSPSPFFVKMRAKGLL
ncbi:MAG: hypothetical protein EAZ09_13860 [Oscillatoriales cyanobacterium]|nr:MAG: hypothetical protein EAZ09_13860 [Oscillatoriales cyanobacterium]